VWNKLLNEIAMISEKTGQLVFFLKFQLIRIVKWFAILLRRDRKLEKISFDYYKNWHSEKSFLVVELKFKNAIYIKVGDLRKFEFSKPLVLNLELVATKTINVEVFGFFQKQVFIIDLKKEIQTNTESFKTTIQNFRTFELEDYKTELSLIKPKLDVFKPKIFIRDVNIKSSPITINFTKFKSQDFL
jgi:hypothetical protein